MVSGLGVLPEVVCYALAAGADAVTSKIGVNWPALARGERPQPVVPPRPVVDLDALRREAIHGTLLVHGRNISDTARALGMTRSSLQRLLRKMPLPVPEDEGDPTEGRE